MKNPNSCTPRLKEFITKLYPLAHGHQVKGFVAFIKALLEARSCTQAKMAATFENKKAVVKRLSRFLHNPRLRTKDLAEGVATEFVSHVLRHAFIRIAIDWTVENGIHTLVASAIIGRRAVPIYWRSYDQGTFKGHRSKIERAFVERLFKVILRDVPRRKLIVTADRGFADVLLFDLLDDLKIAFVIRTRENVKVFFDRQWRKLGDLKMTRNTRRRSLGRLRYCERSPRRFYLTQSRARNRKGQWGIWHPVSNRNYGALQAKQEYERRWGCECGFRDAKHLLGLKEADIKSADAFARMFTLVAIAMLLAAIIGCAFLVLDPKARERLRKVCADRGTHCESSFFSAVLHVLKHDPGLWDYLVPSAKLNLDISLQNMS
ncbi:MAG TPA: transposase [Blastocatellia bacterium]|nr:transposase [Blastocatellia bacterium]HMV84590.1 transposase [Blastocatellia bacterium]HMX26388.1 transposase [Blastocatellia bacterium]HMY75618.1 transposase [Blastocatellia bacterium]HMZ17517.1 transposase [Blastocatellia bacterium]